jgi:hypothetical protein
LAYTIKNLTDETLFIGMHAYHLMQVMMPEINAAGILEA